MSPGSAATLLLGQERHVRQRHVGSRVPLASIPRQTCGMGLASSCLQSAESSPSIPQAGTVNGGVDTDLTEAVAAGASASLRRLTPPGWSMLANPAFCGRYIAYWAIEDGATFASVFDLERGTRSRRVQAYEAEPEGTDDTNALPRPEWARGAESVSFQYPRAGVAPVVLSVH